MKKLYFFILLAFGTAQAFSQSNITIYPSIICSGNNPTFVLNTSAIPSGKTIAYYKYWADSIKLGYGQYIGVTFPGIGTPDTYKFPPPPPGTYTGEVTVVFTDSSRWPAGAINYSVYNLPTADYTLTTNSLDTQCLNGNAFCFINNSTVSSGDTLATCTWFWGDGGIDNNCNPIVCHSYGFVSQFYPTLIVTNTHGCKSVKINPSGYDSVGVDVISSANPDLNWVQVPAPNGPLNCFKTCYRFTNLSILAINKVKSYQWDFGDKSLCENWWEPDSNLYTGTIPYYKQKCDSIYGINDSAHYDTITHCYCEAGSFYPKLAITNTFGCTDSIRKTNSNSGGKPLPYNVNFSFDITTTTTQGGNILADSVCAGSGNQATICFKQTPILGVQPGGMGQGFIWDFGDPNDPNNKNLDSMSWTPCHAYSGMGSFFPSLTIQCAPSVTSYYFAAKVVGPYRRFIDTTYDSQRDLMDPTKITSSVDSTTVDYFKYFLSYPPYPIVPGVYSTPAFDGQAMIVDAIDSVQMQYVDQVSNYAKYKMMFKNKYYGDTAYYFNTQNFTSPYPPYPTIRPDSIPVYKYANYSPFPSVYVPSIGQLYQTIQNLIVPVSFPTGLKDVKADTCLSLLGIHNKPYYYNTIVDTNGNPLNTFWYKYSRSYNYGVRVLGPNAQIELPPAGIVIRPDQKNQCGPDDTVDFVNATGTAIGFKARNIWRQWNFGDVYAPQCTSFSVPHFPHAGMYSWPPVVKIDSFAYYQPVNNADDYLQIQDNLVIMRDTIRMWSDAVEQDRNSDHYFINNGVTYQGRRNCNFSHDTLPRHVYPNWDSVYLWYRYGHDFMPWKKTPTPGGYMFSDTNSRNYTSPPDPINIFANKSWDTAWQGKPIYLNILTGSWSLWQDSSIVTSYVDTTYICNYFTFTDRALNASGIYRSNTNIGRLGKQHFYYSDTLFSNCKKKYIVRDTAQGRWVKWPRIDTLNQALPPAKQLPNDIWPGNSSGAPKGITPVGQIPDPFQMALGNYTLFTGVTIDTASHFPPLFYTLPNGQRFTFPSGMTLLPSSSESFFEYMFRRIVQKCITVTLTLSDSLNNESRTSNNNFPGYLNDGDTLDFSDCNMTSTVQLALGKPDARGMGKQPKECPGLNGQGTQGYPALTFNNKQQPYPGFKLECGGRTSIWVDIDSLADRLDTTPCYLDAFTTWGVGTFGTKILPGGPSINITPGNLQRVTFDKCMNFSPLPGCPWGGPGGTLLQYHMGANSGTPAAADNLHGYVTIGVFIGNGQKDTTIQVWKTNYLNNTTNPSNIYSMANGGLLRDNKGKLTYFDPILGLMPYTYQSILLMDSIANKTTPPPVPIPSGWVDDSLGHTYAFNAIIDRVPKIRYIDTITAGYQPPNPPKIYYDTMYTLQYIDPNWSRCLSDTVWYHNFWRIKELNAAFVKSPLEIPAPAADPPSHLREVGDTLWVVYADSVQDSVKYDVWQWSDNTVTSDSFYLAGFDTTNNFYTHGVRRVRYNFDVTSGVPVIIDSLVWPCGVYGDRQYINYVRFYKRFWDSIGFVAPDILMLRNKCTEPSHDVTTGLFPDTIRVSAKDTTKFPNPYMRFFTYIGNGGGDTLILQSKCPNPSHADPIWGSHGYTNYRDTLYMRMKDTMQYTQSVIVDTSLMLLPQWHVFHKTSWEIALQAGLPQNAISAVYHFMTNSQNCQYNVGQYLTIGIIDTLHIYGSDWAERSLFCKNEPAHFIDSLRYWRYDNQITDVSIPIWGTSRPDGYNGYNYGANEPSSGYPWDNYQFDTIDFWARDSINPSDTLVNSSLNPLTNSQIDFRYFPGKWTNYNNLNYLPYTGSPLTGHWDAVLRDGSTKALIPTSATDNAYENLYNGQVVFIPVATTWGGPGLYAWNHNFATGYWEPCFPPIITYPPLNTPDNDTLNSLTDLSRVSGGIPTLGRTIIYNNGKGTYKKAGMFYWNGSQWVFISNNQYTTFPFYTHRVFWDFGDGTPIVMSTKPSHQFTTYGRFRVLMISRDSIGHFDTCTSYVDVMNPVAKKVNLSSSIIGCQAPATFYDSSFVITGAHDTNTLDRVVSRNWWFTLRFSYPNGLQGQDTITQNSILQNPVWYYNQKGVFKVKMSIITALGCRDTTTDSIIVEGPRPAFKFFSDTIGCKPYRVGIWNLADSFGMRSPSDTPTISTVIYWGDGGQTIVSGRRDTIWHIYADIGVYHIYALGSDAPAHNPNICPLTMTPDTVNGFQRPIAVYVKQAYYAKINVLKDTVCVNQPFDITNTSDSNAYLTYRFERRFADSVLTFISQDSIYGNGPLINQKFDSTGLYKYILFPTSYQPTVPLSAQCALQDTISIRALKPKANFDTIGSIPPKFIFNNHSQAADYYQWIVYQKDSITPRADGQKTVYPPNIDYQYDLNTDTGSFKVCLIAYTVIPSYEKCNDTICKYITYTYQTKIVIPNVFTPNGDGTNDFFKIDIEGELKYDLSIYNRWGTKVFSSGDKTNMWNGKDNNNGADCADGTYFYVFNYQLKGFANTTVHGTITLIRGQ